jgi:hypothetical protein
MGAFIFKEFDVPNPLRVELRDDDLPEAWPHEQVGFSTGGDVVHKRHKLHGRRSPLFHVFHVDDEPIEVRGRFVDYKMGQGHAVAMRARIEAMRARANLLRVVWNGAVHTALLARAVFGEEGLGCITYELKFEIAIPDGVGDPAAQQGAQGGARPNATADTIAAARAYLAARRATPAAAGNLLRSVNAALTAVEGAMDSLGDAMRLMEAQRDRVFRQVRRVTTLGVRVQQLAQQARRAVGACQEHMRVVSEQVLATGREDNWCFDTQARLRAAAQAARSANEAARRTAAAGTTLYRVKPGDTLESIARERLGDAGRAGEIPLGAADVTPGRVVRLPPAAART